MNTHIARAASLMLAWVASAAAAAAAAQTVPLAVTLHWLDQSPPAVPTGVSWGVPWPRGGLTRDTHLRLADANGKEVAVQTWPLAYWPDGSLKWTGHALLADAGMTGSCTIEPGELVSPDNPIHVNEAGESVIIDGGQLSEE